MPFVPCLSPFDVMCFEPQLVIKSGDQLEDEELIFISHIPPNGDSSHFINQPSSIIDIYPIDPFL